jgi:hypothetical protein
MLNVSVPEPRLQPSGIVSLAGKFVAAAVPQHVGVDGERQATPLAEGVGGSIHRRAKGFKGPSLELDCGVPCDSRDRCREKVAAGENKTSLLLAFKIADRWDP